MWGYMINVAQYFGPENYIKYGKVFGKIWIATAFKGAEGELNIFTNTKLRFKNHLSWIEVMKDKHFNKIVGFSGVALTGWSRYDHFLTLCDLLPQAIPSLILNLYVMQFGALNDTQIKKISNELNCPQMFLWDPSEGGFNRAFSCTKFPGYKLYNVLLDYPQLLHSTKTQLNEIKKYITPMNFKYSYLHRKRTEEFLPQLEATYQMLNNYRKLFIKTSNEIFFEETALEWLNVHFMPHFENVYEMIKMVKSAQEIKTWKPRPLPFKLDNYPL
jgi:hexosaminidase